MPGLWAKNYMMMMPASFKSNCLIYFLDKKKPANSVVYCDTTKWLLIYDYMWETYHTNHITKRHLKKIFVDFLQKKICLILLDNNRRHTLAKTEIVYTKNVRA